MQTQVERLEDGIKQLKDSTTNMVHEFVEGINDNPEKL